MALSCNYGSDGLVRQDLFSKLGQSYCNTLNATKLPSSIRQVALAARISHFLETGTSRQP